MGGRPDALTLAAFAGFVLLAGANGTAIVVSNRELAPFWGAALRFVGAAAIFLVLALATKRTFPTGRALLGAALYGLFAFGGTFAFIYWALQFVKPGFAQVVIALAPLLTLLLALAQHQERFRWPALVGALTCFGGIAFIFQEQLTRAAPIAALAALVGAGLCIAEGNIIAKRFPKSDILTTNVVAMGLSGLLLLALSFAALETRAVPTVWTTWLALAFLVVIGSVAAFALALFVLQRWSASAASYSWVLLPLVAVPLSAWITGEAVTLTLLAGGALVIVGVYVGAIWQPNAR